MPAHTLRRCPFCYSDDLIIARASDGDQTNLAVACLECGATGPKASDADPPGHVEFVLEPAIRRGHLMLVLCPLCRWSASQLAIVARLVWRQGVPGAPERRWCSVFQREPGADDEVRPGRWRIGGVAT